MSYNTAKHELFAKYLAEGMDQGAAYMKAGFRPKNKANAQTAASRLIKSNPAIIKRRDELVARQQAAKEQALAIADVNMVKAFALTREDFLHKMYAIYEMGTAAIPVLDNKGNPTGEYRTNLAAAKAALTTLGQEVHGIFVDKKEVKTGSLDVFSDEEIDQKVAENAMRLGLTIKTAKPMH